MTTTTAPAMSPAQFAELGRIARERAGLCLNRLTMPVVESRLAPRLRRLNIESFDLYVRLLTAGPLQNDEFQEMVGLLTGDGGGFFDDAPQFEAFERWALPRILDARKRARRVRVWSAGCGRGCEAYALALLIGRALGPAGADWRIEVLGTDLRRSAIDAGAAGRYPAEALGGTPSDLRRRHLKDQAGEFIVDPTVQQMTLFETHNLLDRAGAKRHGVWDAIFCRGVLGGMEPSCARRTLALLTEQLSPEGFLFMGRGEVIDGMDDAFRPIPLPCAGFQKRFGNFAGEDRP
jgi:chemotaxis protein methyltransferase CheR